VMRGASAAVRAGASLAGAARTSYDMGQVASGASGARGAMAGLGGVASAGVDTLRRTAGGPLQGVQDAYRRGSQQAFSATGGSGPSSQAPSASQGPAWARRLRGEHRMQHAGTLAVHTLRDGDRGSSGAAPHLDDKED